jgi:drug/metabolite transporter (DMT)-like permease
MPPARVPFAPKKQKKIAAMTSLPATAVVPAFSTVARKRLLFAILCLVWGTTWLAMKAGIQIVPPAFFSGTRWCAAGLLLLGWRRWRGLPIAVGWSHVPRLVAVAMLLIVLNASIQQYGLRSVGSGLAAVITSGATPMALLGFSVMLGQERFSWPQAGAIALGLAGLALLFGPSALRGELDAAELGGAAMVLIGCVCYCAGSVLVRPMMRSIAPAQIAALTNLIGGAVLLAASLAFEPGAWEAAAGNWGWAAWSGWWFLLLPGSLGATIIYFLLVRDWGASRAGTYAFVSPVIAVLLGVAVFGERLDITDAVGMALMLAAAGVVLRRTPG